jgi:hypothetical protein
MVGAAFDLGNTKAAASGGRATPCKATAKSIRKGAKGGKKEQKRCPWCVTIAASYDGCDKKADDSDKGHVTATECDFKRQTRPPKEHFEKFLKATCPNHPYPIKHKLKDCTVMKNFMTSRAFSKGRKLGEDPGGKGAAPIPGDAM